MLTNAHKAVMERVGSRIKVIGNTWEFQPGDGTRYIAIVNPIRAETAKTLGCAEEACLLSIMVGPNQYRGMLISEPPYFTYLKEKLGVTDYTANAWAVMIRFIFTGELERDFPWEG